MRKPNWKMLHASSIERTVGVRARTGVLIFALCAAAVGCVSDAGQDVARDVTEDAAPGVKRDATAASADLNQLSWMVGYWSRIEDNSSSEEAWLPPRGNTMVGVHADLYRSGRTFFEYLRVESRGDTLVYLASPRGREAVSFVATEIAPGRAVFSNPTHDYPQHIGYTLVGEDSLRSEIWGSDEGDERRSSWTWARSNLK